MQALVQRSHDLLQDEICQCLYSMAFVDFSSYYEHFVPKFLDTIEGLTDEQHTALIQNYRVVEVSWLAAFTVLFVECGIPLLRYTRQ